MKRRRLAGSDLPPAELRDQRARGQLTAAELLSEGGLELLVREPASAGADLTVDSEGARSQAPRADVSSLPVASRLRHCRVVAIPRPRGGAP